MLNFVLMRSAFCRGVWQRNPCVSEAKCYWVEIAKYSFKGNVISSRWPTFSFRHFEHLARLLKGDQAFLCKVTNKEGILYFA